MGVTIHFSVLLRKHEDLDSVLKAATSFAESREWACNPLDESNACLIRSNDDDEWEYRGPTSGVVLFPDKRCDPLRLEFGTDLRAQDFVKTQFAGVEVHQEIAELFRELEPLFDEVIVEDEGGYWDTRDTQTLTRNIAACDAALKQALDENPTARGPVQLPSGRWADVIL